MSFLTGKTTPTTATDPAYGGLKSGVISSLSGVDPLTGLKGGQVPQAYMDLFQSSLAPGLAQAKESAGNLTGSGLEHILGATAGRSTSDFLLNLLNQTGGRATSLLSSLLQPQQLGYQPGFLDYLFQGASSAAPLVKALA